MKYRITHITEYHYDGGVSFCHNRSILKPRNFDGQTLIDFKLEINPAPSEINTHVDFFGNNVAHFLVQQSHNVLRVKSTSVVKREMDEVFASYFYDECVNVTMNEGIARLAARDNVTLDSLGYLLDSRQAPLGSEPIRKYALRSFFPNRSIFDAALELTQRIYEDFEFESGATDVVTPVAEFFESKKGVCQDFTHFALVCVRSIGLPARYVSGYIETIPPEGKERLVGADASHAWFSIFVPGFGWVDFDPTNNQIPKNQHVTVAWGRDYYDITPLRGVIYSSGENDMKVSVDMLRLAD